HHERCHNCHKPFDHELLDFLSCELILQDSLFVLENRQAVADSFLQVPLSQLVQALIDSLAQNLLDGIFIPERLKFDGAFQLERELLRRAAAYAVIVFAGLGLFVSLCHLYEYTTRSRELKAAKRPSSGA